jgi:hypothetical protein
MHWRHTVIHAPPDLWIRRSPENAERVWLALARFRAPLFDLTKSDLVTPDIVFQIGNAPRRIDLLTSIIGVEFDEAWPNRKSITVDGLSISVIGRDELIANKRASGRPKDLADLVWLESNKGGK